MTIEVDPQNNFQGNAGAGGDPAARDAQRQALGGATAQTWAVTVPHSSGQMAFGRCAAGNGASLTTVGSALVDAVGTLTLQAKGDLTAQTNAVLTWLSQSGTQAHSQAKVEVFAGGGMAPGDCGGGIPAPSTSATMPAETTEKAVNLGLSAACLSRNAMELKAWGASGAGAVVQGADAVKNVLEGVSTATGSTTASGLAAGAEGVSAVASAASGDLAGIAWGAGTAASAAAGGASAGGGGSDIEQRATANIKMVAGKKISAVALAGFDYKTLNKFGVTAGLVVDFTTIMWSAYCLLKWEVKSMGTVKTAETLMDIKAKKEGKMNSTASLTFKAPFIKYQGKLEVSASKKATGHLKVNGDVELRDTLQVDGTSFLKAKLHVQKDVTLKQTLTVSGNTDLAKDIKVQNRLQCEAMFLQMAQADLA